MKEEREKKKGFLKGYAKITLLLLSLTFFGCWGSFGKWEISELYAMKIPNSSKIVYSYDAWGGLDSHAFGFKVLDSTQNFSVRRSGDLSIYDLQYLPNKDSIVGISHRCENSCGEEYENAKPYFFPVDFEKTELEGIEVVRKVYQYKGYSKRSSGLQKYSFDSFKETPDSIFFYKLIEEWKKPKSLDVLKFKKRNVILKENDSSNIHKIRIEDLIIDRETNEFISYKTYFLYPNKTLKVSDFSDYGIFKPVKINEKK